MNRETKGVLQEIITIGNSFDTISDMLQRFVDSIYNHWMLSNIAGVEIVYEGVSSVSLECLFTQYTQKHQISIQEQKLGELIIYYKTPTETSIFFKEDLHQIAAMISGFIAQKKLSIISYDYTERIKELHGITKTTHIFKQNKEIEQKLQEICNYIPQTMQYPDNTVVRIIFDNTEYTTKKFIKTEWCLKQHFKTAHNKQGKIEIFYTQAFKDAYKGPFLKEEIDLLHNICMLIVATINQDLLRDLLYKNNERLKELDGINKTRYILNQARPIDDTLQQICDILPASWQYPKYTCSCIMYEDKKYVSADFTSTNWCMKETFVTFDNNIGSIEIYYTKEFPLLDEGPFLREERNLIINIASLIQGFLNDTKGRQIVNKPAVQSLVNTDVYRESLIKDKQPLQNFVNKQILDKYIYLDMMKYKVKEILFVATLYDAYNLEKDDSFFEKFMGPIYQYSLFSLPRIIGVSSHEQALDLLQSSKFDMVVLMVGADVNDPIQLGTKIREFSSDIPIYLLLNQRSNVAYFQNIILQNSLFNKIFIWNGDSQIFFAMVKSLEDLANVENDTKIGLVRAILLIEDSPYYYSKYLPAIYSVFFNQVGEQIVDYELNELEKISRMRSRPKLLWATNFEQASFLYNKYKDFITCIICDGEFEQSGLINKSSGIKFLEKIRQLDVNLPILIQSSDTDLVDVAKRIRASFILKQSEILLDKIKRFVMHNFGYGDFIFRNSKGKPIGKAKNLREFETMLRTIPDDSLAFHAQQNQFSIWLMGRGEIDLATKMNPIQLSDFKSIDELRLKNIEIFEEHKRTKKRGKILSFEETIEIDENSIVSLCSGSMGGKGRGLAFANALIQNIDFNPFADKIHITTPRTAIIGTDEFENFIKTYISDKNVYEKEYSDEEIKQMFCEGKLSDDLRKKLIALLEQINKPIAVRSSSIFEDSLNQPLAGLFSTYIIPNNSNSEKRIHDLETAIKLVFASVFTQQVKQFYKHTYLNLEEEKMAVVLQELVGNYYDSYFYPHISGVAQSYNFYPVSHMKPEEGFAMCAVGLGFYIVDGGKSYRFSPIYPKLQMMSVKSMVQSSQVEFLAVDLQKQSYDFIKEGERAALVSLSIEEAERHKTLTHCVSVYNTQNDRLEPGLSGEGARVVNFANILEYNYIPLPQIISRMLDTVKEAMGCAVEIEFAVDLSKEEFGIPRFYLLQIKPLTVNVLPEESDYKDENVYTEVILRSSQALGNGVIQDLTDVIFVKPDAFDKMRTIEMAQEIELLNKEMILLNKHYVLVGPGRWGTSDRFLGIPVQWPQISNAKIIVETSLSNFPLDSSLGSHFFHNITSMNVGYFAIEHINEQNFISWHILDKQKVVKETEFFKYVQLKKPLRVVMDGKHRSAVVYSLDYE